MDINGDDPSPPCRFGHFGQRHCNLLDVLGRSGQQTLPSDLDQTSEPGIAVPMQLLGIGKRTLNGFLAPFVNSLAPRREAVGVGALTSVGPDMAGDGTLRLGIGSAGGQKRAVTADRRIGAIVAIAGAVGGGIG